LAAPAVQREHQLSAQPLTGWVLAHEPLELGNELAVATRRQVSLNSILEARQSRFFQVCDLCLRERLIAEVRQRRPPPKI
jgi:short-subunit dehydrogenase involved in D-alanine esterification of teichoic acids